jgi:type II secretory pathway component PulJ
MSRVPKNSLAFSLIDVLVAVAVLAFIFTIFSSILDSIYRTSGNNRKRLAADEEARRVLGRIGSDLKSMLNRTDIDFYFAKNNGNDELYFFSNAPAFFDGSGTQQTVSLIGYRVKDHKLERLGYALSWEGGAPAGLVFLTKNGTSIVAASTLRNAYTSVLDNDENYQTIGNGIFRFEVKFLLRPVPNGNATFSESPYLAGGSSPYTNTGNGFSDLVGIQVSIALIDQESRKILSESDLDQMAARFSDDATTDALPFGDWEGVANNAEALNIPLKAAGHVRFYRRHYYIGHSL